MDVGRLKAAVKQARAAEDAGVFLPEAQLGRLMPMMLRVDPEERIVSAGPTLMKLIGADALGALFSDHFEQRHLRPSAVVRPLREMMGQRVQLCPRAAPETVLRGAVVRLPETQGVLLNLTFGAGLIEAVRLHGLTEADFAPSDLAMELLYLHEAKSVVMGELRGLTDRLDRARQAAEEQALTDPLTGVANRRAFDMALRLAIEQQEEAGTPFAVAHVDLDLFKSVNDTHGHAAGDHVLIHVAKVLREETRRADVVARIGGDEFVLLLRGRVDAEDLQALGDRIIRHIEEPTVFEGESCRVSASIGVAVSGRRGETRAEAICAQADGALYASKRRGRGRCTVVRAGDLAREDQRGRAGET